MVADLIEKGAGKAFFVGELDDLSRAHLAVDDEEAGVGILGEAVEEDHQAADVFDVVFAAAGHVGKGVDDDKLGLVAYDLLNEALAVGEIGKVDDAVVFVGELEEDAVHVDVPILGALVVDAGGDLGVDVEDGVAGIGDGLAVGEGCALDDAIGEVEGDEGLAGAGGGAEEGDHAAGDPAGPEPLDGEHVAADLGHGGEPADVVAGLEGADHVDELHALEGSAGDVVEGLGFAPGGGFFEGFPQGFEAAFEVGGGVADGEPGEFIDDGLVLHAFGKQGAPPGDCGPMRGTRGMSRKYQNKCSESRGGGG